MTDLGELVGCFASHALSRRVGGHESRPFLFDPAQLEEQRVVLGVGDLGLVEHVIGVLVTADLRSQLDDPRRGVYEPFSLAHFVSGASMPLRIFRPALSNLITSSSSVRVSVLFTTVPAPNAGCLTRSPLVNRCTRGAAGADGPCRSRKRSL